MFLLGYRAMRYSAKRGIAIACRLSVRPSVCLTVCDVGRSGPHSLEILETIIARAISPTPLLFATQRSSTYSQGNMGKFGD